MLKSRSPVYGSKRALAYAVPATVRMRITALLIPSSIDILLSSLAKHKAKRIDSATDTGERKWNGSS